VLGFVVDSLKAKIEDLIHNNVEDFKIAKVIKEHLDEYYKTLPLTFAQSGGKDFLLKHTKKIDNIIKLVYQIATREMFKEFFPTKNAVPLTIAALGSYAREQLSPKSDIDIMFVYKEVAAYNTKDIIEKMLYLLWDCGMKLGHRVHEISELEDAAKSDITIKTALLESRFLDGSKYLWYQIENNLVHIRQQNVAEFIEAKIEERRALRAKYPLMMEPNLKEGVGGFRDANIVYWIGKILYNAPRIKDLPTHIVKDSEYAAFRVALEFLFRVRSALHLVVKRKTDRLLLEFIPDVASYLGYNNTPQAHLKFTKKVHKSLRVIWLYSRIWLDRLASKKIEIYKNYLKCEQELKEPSDVLDLLIANANKPYRSHPQLNAKLLSVKKEHLLPSSLYPKILDIFRAKHTSSILVALSEVNQLGYYISPIKKIEALPQFDGYHKYPVDTHLIKTIEALENIDDQEVKNIFLSLSREQQLLLKIATFLHDCGKGRNSDHHKVGAIIFKAYSTKLGFSKELINLGSKLIMHHNKLSLYAQKEDIYNHKTIAKIAALFPTKLELDIIYLLTYADVKSVGDGVYNELNARLFKNLYINALEFLQHKEYLDEVGKRLKKSYILERSKEFKALPRSLQKKILSIESNLPFIKYSKNRIIQIAKRATQTQNYIYEITNNKFLTIEIIRKQELDLGYLLANLRHLNVVNLDIVRLFNGKKYFKIDFSQTVDESYLPEVEVIIKNSFLPQERISLPKPEIEYKDILVDCNHSSEYALMKLKVKDQKGILAFVMNLFENLKIEIVSAKSNRYKNAIVDLFLIDKNGNFCKNLETIKSELSS
jgi:[protein-PII] uridylyltransferase